MTKRRINLNCQKGTSLAELLVVSAMVTVVLAAILAVVETSLNSYMSQVGRAANQDATRLSMTRIQKEVRQAEKPLLQATTIPDTEQLAFKVDINGDGTSEAIRYELNRSTMELTRQVNPSGDFDFSGCPKETLAEYVRNAYYTEPVFTYYAVYPGPPLTSDFINKARVVRIWLKLDTDLTKSPAASEVVTFIKLRDFGY